MKHLIQKLLAALARAIVRKYKPRVVGITGSVGKTSTRQAVFAMVSQQYRAYTPSKNFNNEFGLPFGAIGVESPGRSALRWLSVFLKASGLLLFHKQYPEVLVLEFGVDHPGDMDHLLSIVRPDIAIITNIGISHYEFFRDVAAVEEEKGKLASCLAPDGVLIVNADNPTASAQRVKTHSRVISYGEQPGADIRIIGIQEQLSSAYTEVTLKANEHLYTGRISAVGLPHVSAIAAAVAVAVVLTMKPEAVKQGLEHYRPVPGRLTLVPGIKESMILDDTYNAAPDSVQEALRLFGRMPQTRKLVVLGDMLELGALTEQKHREVGAWIAAFNPERFITVGRMARIMAESAKQHGYSPEKVLSFDASEQAGKMLQDILQPGSAVLVKGSQSIRMERIVKEIMAEPLRAQELLCRQYGKWLTS